MEDPSSSEIPTSKHQGFPRTPSPTENGKAHKNHKRWHHLRNVSKREAIKSKLRPHHEACKTEESFINGNYRTPKTKYKSDDDGFTISNPTLISTTNTRINPTTSEKLRNLRHRSTTPTPTSTDFLASLRANLSEDVAATTNPRSTPTTEHRDTTPLGSRMPSKQYGAPTPIIYSHSTATVRKKPPPVEKTLACTLEELCYGGVKKIKITRDVISNLGMVVQEEILTINIKPGWKKGTKITFEGKGDEKPGFHPANITFIIDEKRHNLFKRLGNDLMLGVEIPLVQALTGCTITVPLLGEGETMDLSFDDTILYPGYEKIIPGQGMPKPKGNGSRGDLRLQFLVEFPKELSDEQRSEFVSILEDCS